MGYMILMGCILAPFLIGLGLLGYFIDWLNGWKESNRDKPKLGKYPEPKRRETVYGDGLDDFITNEEDIA